MPRTATLKEATQTATSRLKPPDYERLKPQNPVQKQSIDHQYITLSIEAFG